MWPVRSKLIYIVESAAGFLSVRDKHGGVTRKRSDWSTVSQILKTCTYIKSGPQIVHNRPRLKPTNASCSV